MNGILRWSLLVSVLLAWPAGAAQVEDPAGLENLRKIAETGDPEAMLELGILYEFGYRMPDHKAPALAWYRLAAEAGSEKAIARQDALRATMSAKEVEDANKLYTEYAATVRKPAPPATAPETPSSTPSTSTDAAPASPAPK